MPKRIPHAQQWMAGMDADVDRSTIVPFFLRGEDRFREQKLTGALPGGRCRLGGSANARFS